MIELSKIPFFICLLIIVGKDLLKSNEWHSHAWLLEQKKDEIMEFWLLTSSEPHSCFLWAAPCARRQTEAVYQKGLYNLIFLVSLSYVRGSGVSCSSLGTEKLKDISLCADLRKEACLHLWLGILIVTALCFEKHDGKYYKFGQLCISVVIIAAKQISSFIWYV